MGKQFQKVVKVLYRLNENLKAIPSFGGISFLVNLANVQKKKTVDLAVILAHGSKRLSFGLQDFCQRFGLKWVSSGGLPLTKSP